MARAQSHRHSAPAARAFTLIEAVLSSLIVGVAMVPALGMLGATAVDRRTHADLARGMSLAKALMGEIVQCKYFDPSANTGVSRTTWTQLQDYNAMNESPPTTQNGAVIPDCTGWRRTVAVRYVVAATPDSTTAIDAGLQKVTVTVTSPAGKVYTLSALRSNCGMPDRIAAASATSPTAVTITLQGTGGDSAFTSVNLPNQVP